MLRDQIVSGINDVTMQTRLLETTCLTFETAKDTVVAMEAARKDSRTLSCQQAQLLSHEAPEQANVVTSGKNDSCCFRCGGGHSARRCKHSSTICHNCRQKGHLARVCRVQPGSRNFDRSQSSRVNNLGDLPVSAEEPEVFDLWTLHTASSEPMRIAVEVNGIMLDIELDTGASVSTIDDGKFAELFPSVPLEPSSVQLRSFFGDMKRVQGKLEAMVKLGDKERQLPLFVVKGACPTLFGRSWMKAFKLGIAQTEGVNVVKSTEDLVSQYHEVFSEQLGTFHGVTASISVQKGAKPRFVKARPIPFALRDRVFEELQRMEREGVIKPVKTS